jgi:hypothetical protein
VGKKGRRKEYITCTTYVAPVSSLKTLHEKIQWEKTHQGKKSTTVDVWVRSSGPIHDLRDHVMSYDLRVGLPLNLQFSESSHANSTDTSVECGGWQRLCE